MRCLISTLNCIRHHFHFINSFFQTMKNNIPSIDSIFKEVCESEITVQELDAAVKKSKPGKSPGPDV